jgi:hypothetical protein
MATVPTPASLTQPLFDGSLLLGQLELQKGLQD